MAKAKRNELRFRRGVWLLLLVAIVSAASTTALYWGIRIPFLYSTSLAIPVVADIAINTFFSGWIMLEKIQYYWFIASSILAGLLAAMCIFCLATSFSGRAFSGTFTGRALNKFFGALGMAQLVGARAMSAFCLLFYMLDLALSALMVLAFPQTFTPLYLFLMGNLLIHLLVLAFLGYSFTASVGGTKEIVDALAPQDEDTP